MAFFSAVNSLISYTVLHILMCIEKKIWFSTYSGSFLKTTTFPGKEEKLYIN
jgi:hypothetical protein